MLYVESRKSFKVRREKKLIYLPSAKKHSAKQRHSAKKLPCGHPSASVPAVRSLPSVC